MSNVDDELAQAVRESEEAAQAVPAQATPPAPALPKPRPKRSLGLLVALLAMGAGILTLVFTNFKDSMVWAKDVDKLDESAVGRNLNVQGVLKRGTLMRRDDPCEYRFTLMKGKSEIDVRLPRCTIPDNLRDVPGMPTEVTVQGTIASGGYVQATQVMAKCPTKYEMQERAAKGEKMPHDAVGTGMPAL